MNLKAYFNPRLLSLSGALFAVSLFLPTAAFAGVVVNSTRFVYPAESNGLSVSMNNTSAEPYLIQTRVLADDGQDTTNSAPAQRYTGTPPFAVLPPLFTLNGKQGGKVRLVRTGGNLPADRESLFYLSVGAIPGGKPGPNTVQMAVRNRFKLFFRPQGLAGDPGKAYSQLSWQRKGAGLSVSNPTPYYVTLFKLTLNGHEVVNAGMVPPLSTRSLSGCRTGQCQVSWQSIDDFGRILPPQQATL
ncbi:Chaperone protein fimC precursor [Serratia quinivorans]|uniref:Molecular chaperone n=1 Tax=Serratia quinivorans TaxID=137545 RepID=A0ABV3UJU1_9GAMM|nr:molecular chaperone [Serratia quinivorans]CAI1725384.1 Chaperone protein fimC precursor [Serratia quinivorans]